MRNIDFDTKSCCCCQKHFPDWRRALNELQRYSFLEILMLVYLVNIKSDNIKELMGYMKKRSLLMFANGLLTIWTTILYACFVVFTITCMMLWMVLLSLISLLYWASTSISQRLSQIKKSTLSLV